MQHQHSRLDNSNGASVSGGTSSSSMSHYWEEEIISEQLTRNVQFFGDAGQRAFAGALVVVVGLGVRMGWQCLGQGFDALLCGSALVMVRSMHGCSEPQAAIIPTNMRPTAFMIGDHVMHTPY